MVQAIGVLCVILLFNGGAYVQAGNFPLGLGLTSLGGIILGTLFAAVQSANRRVSSFDTREGLSLTQLHKFLSDQPSLTGDTKVYVGDQGLNVAGSVFVCLLDGHRTVVIERQAERGTPAEVPHDLF